MSVDVIRETGSQPHLSRVIQVQRAAFLRDGPPDLTARLDRVARLQAMVLDNATRLAAALAEDFGTRAHQVSMLTDVAGCLGDLKFQQKHLGSWMRTERRAGPARLVGLDQRLRRDPLGVVGVMGPWNFPVQLVVIPAGSALAAGNRVVVRPSEVTRLTSALLAAVAPTYFSDEELVVVTDEQCGGPEFAGAPWDHLMFTGSPQVGALVAEAAGRNLVPVTLELGGKNPAVVDVGSDLRRAAERLAASRLVNGGQVCMAPDYVFVPEADVAQVADHLLEAWRTSVPRVVDNPQYTSIVNERHFDRVCELVDDAERRGATVRRHVPAGETLPDRNSRKIAPTLLLDVPRGAAIETEEIFGPVIALYSYRDLGDVIDVISSGPHPLTMYWYGDDNERFRRLQASTRSGSVNANDFVLNLLTSDLPFGGVGASGSGAYRGRAGFETFTHARAVTFSRLPVSIAQLMAPPYSRADVAVVRAQVALSRRRVRRARRP